MFREIEAAVVFLIKQVIVQTQLKKIDIYSILTPDDFKKLQGKLVLLIYLKYTSHWYILNPQKGIFS